jgi:tetratricopeptide (TPR) repeat protein
MTDRDSLPTLSPAQARLLDQACDRFEAAWKAGQRPTLSTYLAEAGGKAGLALLHQLLLLDWEYRQRAGEKPGVADYQAQFPDATALVEAVGREMDECPVSTCLAADPSQLPETVWLSEATQAASETPALGDRYDLMREVGHGGIGVVFRGRDRQLGRELAVKVLREAYRDHPDARRRFVEEARVGSQLQHPAIVPVYDQGWFTDRRPYITMKLVEGHTLAALLHERTDPSQNLPRFLGIFEQACQAMAYAHARGILHRDLKPANIMVGAFGEVQVMDWGFAKTFRNDETRPSASGESAALTKPADKADAKAKAEAEERGRDGHVLTQSGAMMGTPAYMPPEQARGETGMLDPRTDVFALGAILCEILTGQPPYGGRTADEVCGQAMTGDVHAAHARLDACAADPALRELAKGCLSPEREDRPSDAGVVARAVTAYLASAQERLQQAQIERAAAEARAQEAAAKARAERRARRLTLALAAALLLGAGVAAWQALVATDAKHTALAAAAAEKEAKEVADTRAAETRSVLNFVQEHIFAAARPEGQAGGLGHDVTLRLALEAALPVVESSFADQPLVEARLRLTLGTSFRYLGEARIAADQFERARALYTEHLGPNDPATLESQDRLADALADLDRQVDALELREQTLALRRSTLGPDHADTLRSMHSMANSYEDIGRHDAALQLYDETVSMQRATLGPGHEDTLATMNSLALCYSSHDRYADAGRLHAEILRLREAKFGPHHPDTLKSRVNLAASYLDLKDYKAALKLQLETLELLRAKLGPTHPHTITAIYLLANTYGFLEKYDLALQYHQEALDLRRVKFGPEHRLVLWSMWGVAAELYALGCGADAVPITDEVLARAAKLPVQPDLVGLANRRCQYFEKAKDAAGCRTTAELWEKLHRSDPKSLYNAACYRAVTAKVLRASQHSSSAEAEADRAMDWLRQAVGAGYKNVELLKRDTDMDALRGRPDFRALLAELEDRSKSTW